MNAVSVVLAVLGIALAVACACCLWRFLTLRSKGYPVVMRPLPNGDGRHWRHGVLVYSATAAKFYKLRSILPESNLTLTRLGTSVQDRRRMTPREKQFLETDLHIVRVLHRAQEWEIALDAAGDTALVAWLESGPSARRDRNSAFNKPRPMEG